MSETRFTPGPWESHGEHEITSGDYDKHVATAWNNDGISPDEATANARLIAASPDLLAACIEALDYIATCNEPSCDEGEELEDGTIHDGTTPEGNRLRAAITKATGGTP